MTDRKALAANDVGEMIAEVTAAPDLVPDEPSPPGSALAARRMFARVRARSGLAKDVFVERVKWKLSARYPGRETWSPMEWLVCAWLVVDGPDNGGRAVRLT